MIVSAKETKEREEVAVGANTGKRARKIISQMATEGNARDGQDRKNTGHRGRG